MIGSRFDIIVDRLAWDRQVQDIGVAIDAALAGLGENDEFMGKVAADRPGLGPHRNGLEAHAGEDPQIGNEHALIGTARRCFVDIEGIGVLHQKLAAAHHAEPRPLLVAELPLDVIEDLRQLAIAVNGRRGRSR